MGDAGDLHVQVDAVEERSREPGAVALDHQRRAGAVVLGIAQIAAGAGIHSRHQHEGGGIGEAHRRTADTDLAVLQGLAQHLQDVLFEFRQFVQKQHAVVGQGDLAGPGNGAAADQAGVGDGVVGRTEGANGDQSVAAGAAGRRWSGSWSSPGPRRSERAGRIVGSRRASIVLPLPGGPTHQEIVASGRRDLEGPLDVLLAADLGEVIPLEGSAGENLPGVYPAGCGLALSAEKGDHLPQVPHAEDRQAVDDGRLRGVFLGKNATRRRPIGARPPATGRDAP